MSKKKDDKERKPDLNEADNQAEIEARIKEMMELDAPKPVTTAIPVISHDEAPQTAPELPAAKKPLSIKIIDHNELEPDTPDIPEPVPAETPESDPDVLAAIKEANEQLKAGVRTEDTLEEPAEDEEPAEPEVPELDAPETPEEALDEPEAPESEEPPEEEQPEAESETEDDSEDEDEEAPQQLTETEEVPKEKPLKHLDSIVPKNKVESTLEDSKTDEAVEDIIAKEGDALLKAEDEKLAAAFTPAPKRSFGQKLRGFLKKKSTRYIVLLTIVCALAVGGAVPAARYTVLNTAGVRSSASLRILDESTQQPLKGVKVMLANTSAVSDSDGTVRLDGLLLGQTNLIIEKRAFAPVNRPLTVGWGSNPLGEFSLPPTGTQYRFIVTDFLSGKPVAKIEASSNEATAISNEKGEIRLTIDQQDDAPRDVVLSGQGYREERFPLDLNQKTELAINLVPVRKHVFISTRSGRYDVYKVDADGKNEKLVLPGTGSEREDMMLLAHPTDEVAALVSTKDNKRNADGFLLSTLTVMNLESETAKSVATSERVQIIDWVGSRLVYVQVKEGASGNSPDRHKLMSYDHKTQEYKELAVSNYFNDVLVAGERVYFAPSSAYSANTSSSLYRISADGGDKITILNKEVWNMFRTGFDRLAIAVEQEWYELRIGETKAGKISGEPPSQVSRTYILSPDMSRALWVDIRDGKGVLLAYGTEDKKDETIRTQGGLKQPVRWLSNSTIIYRINTESETADYVLNLAGGEPKKIRDVTNTSGVNSWYYY